MVLRANVKNYPGLLGLALVCAVKQRFAVYDCDLLWTMLIVLQSGHTTLNIQYRVNIIHYINSYLKGIFGKIIMYLIFESA